MWLASTLPTATWSQEPILWRPFQSYIVLTEHCLYEYHDNQRRRSLPLLWNVACNCSWLPFNWKLYRCHFVWSRGEQCARGQCEGNKAEWRIQLNYSNSEIIRVRQYQVSQSAPHFIWENSGISSALRILKFPKSSLSFTQTESGERLVSWKVHQLHFLKKSRQFWECTEQYFTFAPLSWRSDLLIWELV